ncbi:protein phosphatase 1B isoform X4 [Octopus vulgaris]|uniref:Protein phosphatase 1B isoform X4 n=1 Tax=Octopus vulgaris TaxID=6645 RepID=A0AA36EV26_OCTVU|nr:protein phosphatase 1B isoform X4 [Octopus vulgaris]
MSNEELCDFVRSRMHITESLEDICNQVVDRCLYTGSRDNTGIVLIAFPGAPKLLDEERGLNTRLENKIKEILDNCKSEGDVDLSLVMNELIDDKIEGLPPGGGLSSKRMTVGSILKRLRPGKI